MKSVLVTGGAGYIGSHVVLALIEAGEHVVILDDLSSNAPVPTYAGVVFVNGSVQDEALVERIIKEHEIDAIIHMAAFIKVDESMRDPEKYFRNNAENTKILFETAKRCGVEHFIFSSTAAVYGNAKKEFISEDDELAPVSPYAESKLRAEQAIAQSSQENDAPGVVVLRYFNVAGADPEGRAGYVLEPHPTHLIRAALRAALDRHELTIFGTDYPTKDGTCVRDYVHVSDLAQAHVAALKYLRKARSTSSGHGGKIETFNYGYGRGYSVREVIDAVQRVLGEEISVNEGARREGDAMQNIADNSRIKQTLAIEPRYDDLDTIIAHELAWVRSQQK